MSETRRKPWFRAWDEMLTDPKMRDLTDAQWGIWLKLLCLANQQSQRGLIIIENSHKHSMSTIASLLNTRSDKLATNLRLFSDKNMVEYDMQEESGYVLISNWNKRQFASDDVTARVLKHKERKRLRKRSITEQNRTEGLSKDLRSGSDSSYLSIEDDSVVALDASPPESPLTDNPTYKEQIMLTYNIDEEMLEKFLGRNGEQELSYLIEYAKQYHGNGDDHQVNAALWHTLTFYDPKRGPASAKLYFKQELEERTGGLNAVAEAG
jgi:hypothetical protein